MGATRAAGIVVFVVLALVPIQRAYSELRPLVREMIENLGAIDQIGAGVALEDWDKVARAAKDLEARGAQMKAQDLAVLGLDPARDPQFDAYLGEQMKAAALVSKAAKLRDGRAAMRGVQKLFRNSCLACHLDFREAENLLRPSALFMTTFLRAWQDVNRGLAVNDFSLVDRGAQEIAAMGRVLSWDQVVQDVFGLQDPLERRDFREFVRRVTTNASRMATAADREDRLAIVLASGEMWRDGCIACHERFRVAE